MEHRLIPYLSEAQIDRIVSEMAESISGEYASTLKDSLVVVLTLKGALLFGADLIRRLTVPVEVDTIRVASYGKGTTSAGEADLRRDIETDIRGRDVLVLDEIVDSGRTTAFLREHLFAKRPRSLRFASLLSKPSRREVVTEVEFIGREVEDAFLVGYGLDYGEKYRALPYIAVVEFPK